MENIEINKEKQSKTKKGLFLILKVVIVMVIIFLILVVYSRFIEPKLLNVNEYKVTNSLIPNNFHGTKVVHFSNLYFKSTINDKDINKVISKINLLKPDIVIFSGDLLLPKHNYDIVNKEFLTNALKDINARLGKYYVTGDSDTNLSIDILNNADFININDKTLPIYYKDNNYINITGFNNSLNVLDTNVYNILVSHNSNNIQKVSNSDLFLSANSYNYQIRIPFIDKEYGYYSNKINNTDVFINNGIGTINSKFRFNSLPTIDLYRLTNY